MLAPAERPGNLTRGSSGQSSFTLSPHLRPAVLGGDPGLGTWALTNQAPAPVLTLIFGRPISPVLGHLICEMGVITVLLHKVLGRIQGESPYKAAQCLAPSAFAATVLPVPPTALGGWPCSCFTGEDLVLKVTCPTHREGKMPAFHLWAGASSIWGRWCIDKRPGVPLANGRLCSYSAKGRVTPRAASRELPTACPPGLFPVHVRPEPDEPQSRQAWCGFLVQETVWLSDDLSPLRSGFLGTELTPENCRSLRDSGPLSFSICAARLLPGAGAGGPREEGLADLWSLSQVTLFCGLLTPVASARRIKWTSLAFFIFNVSSQGPRGRLGRISDTSVVKTDWSHILTPSWTFEIRDDIFTLNKPKPLILVEHSSCVSGECFC